MIFSSRNLFVALGSFTAVAAMIVACGSDDESKFNDGKLDDPQFGNDAGFNGDVSSPQEDLYKNDPPPQWCGPDGGPAAPPPPGGTEECPDDKNKPGCACNTPGQKAACWTGLRKHRNLGICHDGETTCIQKNETTFAWGPCEGQQLPDPNATKGAPACSCFSQGQWKIANLSPCSATYDPDADGPQPMQYATVSTLLSTGKCPTFNGPATKPAEDWSTDTLKVDCAGTFKLKYRIRAGSFETPSPSDCVVGEVELPEAFYPEPNVEMPWPNLPAWIGADPACAQKWATTPAGQSPGYGEMIVKGESVRCDKIDDGSGGDFVFNRIKYCPISCNDDPTTPDCQACQQSGQGTF